MLYLELFFAFCGFGCLYLSVWSGTYGIRADEEGLHVTSIWATKSWGWGKTKILRRSYINEALLLVGEKERLVIPGILLDDLDLRVAILNHYRSLGASKAIRQIQRALDVAKDTQHAG